MARMKDGKVARDSAFELFALGKRPSDPEVKALDLKSKTCYNYFQEWKKLNKGDPDSPPLLKKVDGRVLEVGKITITPENWGLSQYGSLLILDTYNKTKRDINYGGTIGEFLCDMCEFYRRILNYKEVEYDGATSEGTGVSEEDGEAGTKPVPELTE